MNVQTLIDRTRNHLMTGKQDRTNTLLAGVTAGATTLTLTYAANAVNEGAVLSIGTEDYYVVSVASNAPGSAITVIPGWNGSTSIAHLAGDSVRVQAQFSDNFIHQALSDAIETLTGEGCFYVKTLDITFNPSVSGYEFTAPDFIQAYRVRASEPGPGKAWPVFRPTDYYVDIHADTTEFPSGQSITLRMGGHASKPVQLSYKARFGDFASLALTDDVSTIGVHPEGQHALSLCAAWHLMTGREVKRNFTTAQPEPRRSEEVPPGAVKGSADAIRQAYLSALNTYRKYLHRLYPPQLY